MRRSAPLRYRPFENKKHITPREIFLQRMDKLIPWARMEEKIARSYPKGETGRPSHPLADVVRSFCF